MTCMAKSEELDSVSARSDHLRFEGAEIGLTIPDAMPVQTIVSCQLG